jgi:hypothetical protein
MGLEMGRVLRVRWGVGGGWCGIGGVAFVGVVIVLVVVDGAVLWIAVVGSGVKKSKSSCSTPT